MTATTEPNEFNAGENLVWNKTLADYPAGTWTLTYTLFNESNAYAFAATADGTTHAVDVPSATTATWAAGKYNWTAYATNGTEQHSVGDGTWKVRPNPATLTARDGRSHAQKMVDAIEAHLESQATTAQLAVLSAALGDRQTSWKPEYLLTLRDKYKAELAAEERQQALANGEDRPAFIKTRFSNA